MSEQAWLALIQFATRFGLDAALAIAQNWKPKPSVDEAIAALEAAKTKTAADYIAEAKAAEPPVP